MDKFNVNYARDCVRGDPPFCTAACPFDFPVREFISKLERGSLSAAYKVYRQAVLFPALVSRICDQACQGVCPRSQTDAAVRLQELERAVVALTSAREQAPQKYNLPPKSQQAAVIGGGPCGLALALRLSAKGYGVTVFEKERQLGGSFLACLEADTVAAELTRQSQASPYRVELGREILDLDELSGEYQAIFIASGKDGNDFGCGRVASAIHASAREGVFLGGQLTGLSLLASIRDGALAAVDIEKYLKLGSTNFAPEQERPCRLPQPKPAEISPQAAVVAADIASGYSKEETVAEAGRCLKCDCERCYTACDFMQYHRKYPSQLASAVEFGLRLDVIEPNTNNRMVNACADCGLCRAVCPAGLDSGEQILLARHQMFEQGQVSPAYHEYLLRDMEHALSDAAFLSRPAPSGQTKYAFFPGCQLTASDWQYTRAAYELLLQAEPQTGLMLACCGAPAYWSGDEELQQQVREQLLSAWEQLGQPMLVLACPSCAKHFRRFLPQLKWVSLWSLLKSPDLSLPTLPPQLKREFALAHPCAAKDDPAWDEDVRALLAKLAVDYQPMSEAGESACCGYGGDIGVALPQLMEQMAANRLSQSDLPYLCYCANCRDIYASRGKEAWHLLDLLLQRTAASPAPHLTQRRRNREQAKSELLAQFWQQPPPATPLPDDHIQLLLDDELRRMLDAERLTEDDIRRVLAFAQASGLWLEKADGLRIAHLDLGVITAWVEYRPVQQQQEQQPGQQEQQTFSVSRVYCHRMKIEEAGREAPRLLKRQPHYVRS